MSKAARTRRDAIKGYLLGQPATIADLAKMFSLSYYTIRNDINALSFAGDIFIVGQAAGGAALYSANSQRVDVAAWPQVYKGPLGEWNFMQAVSTMVGTRYLDTGVRAMFEANRVLYEILAKIPNDNRSNPDIAKLRNKHASLIEHLEASIRMHRTINKDQMFWSQQGLNELKGLDGVPSMEQVQSFTERVHDPAAEEFHNFMERMKEFGKNAENHKEPDPDI